MTPPSWDSGTEISIIQDGDELLYSWNEAFDENEVVRYELLVNRDGDFVVQENTNGTSLSFKLGYFENPGIYTVLVTAYDTFENNSFITTQFEIIAPETTNRFVPESGNQNSSPTTTVTDSSFW